MNMKKITFKPLHYCVLVLSLICVLVTKPVTSDCLTSYDPSVDYFLDKISGTEQGPDVGFTIEYNNSYKIVTNLKTNEVYVLYCTSTQPQNISRTVKTFIQIPVKSVAGLERSTLSFLEILGVQSTLKYIENNATIVSPCLQKNNSVKSFNPTTSTDVDVVFTNGTSLNSTKEVSVTIGDDLSPIKKAEWVKFISLFYNLEKTALNSLDGLKNVYSCNKNNLADIPSDKKKIVAWVAYRNDTDIYSINLSNYYANLTIDAGAITLNATTTSVKTAEDFQKIISSAHIVIDQTEFVYPNDTYDYWCKLFGYANSNDPKNPYFLRNKLVFRTTKTKNALGFSDWVEHSSSRPDIALQDLIAVQYPTYRQDYVIRWLERFSDSIIGDVITKDNCIPTLENASTQPISDFGKCTTSKFLGDNSTDTGNSNNDDNNNNNNNAKNAIIITASIFAGLLVIGLATWLFIYGRKKYRERFVELKDEPEIQLSDIKDVK